MKYYIAAFQRVEENPYSCLLRHGFSEGHAQTIIANAAINQSRDICAPIGNPAEDNRAILLAKNEQGKWVSYRAIMDMKDTREEAQQLIADIKAQDKEMRKLEWAIVEFVEPPASMSKDKPV